MKCVPVMLVIAGWLTVITGCAGTQQNQQQNSYQTEPCTSRSEAFVGTLKTLSMGLLAPMSILEASEKTVNSLDNSIYYTSRAVLYPGNEEYGPRSANSIDKFLGSIGNIGAAVLWTGKTILLTPYNTGSGLYTLVVGCPESNENRK